MKLIDKYLLREYVVPILCCLFGFCMLYVVSGLFDRASDFIRAGVSVCQIVYFYSLSLVAYADQSNVSFLVTILPISLLAAALYSLSRLTRQNELSAMCACGVSLVRLMVPFLGVGLACSILAVVIQEWVAPRASTRTDEFLAVNGKPESSPVVISRRYYDVDDGWLWRVEKVNLGNPTSLVGVELRKEFSEEIKKVHPYSLCLYETVITNAAAEWSGNRWLFSGKTERRYHPNGMPDGPPRGPEPGSVEIAGVKASPADIAFGIDSVKAQKYFSASAVLRWLNSKKLLSNELIMQSVDAHVRQAMPWACIVAVMLAIPAGVRGGREGVISGMLLAVALFMGFYLTKEFTVFLGKKLIVWPWLAAWFANMVFFVVGTVMIRRIRN